MANRLDDDCVQQIRDCLRAENIRLSGDGLFQLISNIESDIAAFCDARSEGTFREAHDQLRYLWEKCLADGASADEIRALIDGLSKRATDYVNRRFPVVMERLSPDRSNAADFKTWARTAQAGDLIRVSRVLAADGAQVVPGRSRGRGKRSASRLSPQIMGAVRGDPTTGAQRGGRPANNSQIDLVGALALSWYHATDKMPKRGRSGRTGFGALVFLVFEWLGIRDDIGEESGVHALRQYWSLVPKRTRRNGGK
jgi:hypothetical protein